MVCKKKEQQSYFLEHSVYTDETHDQLLTLVAQIVSALAGNNAVSPDLLPRMIRDVYDALASVAPPAAASTNGQRHRHAHPPEHRHAASQGVSDDLLTCLEDGLSMKMLKRHLLTVHGLTPDQYRAKWGLPPDYPMVAANYAKLRSNLAKESGLGLRPEARPKRRRA